MNYCHLLMIHLLKVRQKGAFNNPYKLQSSSEKDRILEFASKHFAETGKTAANSLLW